MAQLTPELQAAFKSLGVSPGDDHACIRSAWRAMVRRYHPDRIKGDKAAANRLLAELNAAYDAVSQWSPEKAKSYTHAQQARRSARRAAQRKAQAEQRAEEQAARRRAAEAAKQEKDEAMRRARVARAKGSTGANDQARQAFLRAIHQTRPIETGQHSFTL